MSLISDFLENSSRKLPKKTAIIAQDKTYTYSELNDLTLTLSSALSKHPKKTVISIIFENTSECVALYLGVLRSGCIAHLVSPNISEINLNDQLRSSNSKLIIGPKSSITKINANTRTTDFDTLLTYTKTDEQKKIFPNDIAYLIYTSGTTSKPKGVAVSHANSTFTIKNIIRVLGYVESDVDVLPLPLSHSFGLGCLHTSLCTGSTLVLHKNTVDMLAILDSIKLYNATTFTAVPATLTKLLKEFPNKIEEYFSNLRLVMTNSTYIPLETVNGFTRIIKKGKLATYYGLTEASRSTFMIFNNGKETSVGLPAPEVQIKLIDEQGKSANRGEIWIKGGNVIEKYWNNPEADKNLIDGWLKTGDIGQLDNDGYLYLTGRVDDLINVAGEKVIPEEIERIVKLLSGVEEAVAIGTKHDIFGQVVKLFVKRSTDSLEKSEIISHCIKNLERYKVPTVIQFVDDFPKTEYGKIKRFMLE